ncbi:MAG: DnaJ C-terminal domain-containing protein [Pseudomonadota bacterium]
MVSIHLVHDLHLSATEALYGVQKEIFLKKGLETRRMTIKIPPGIEDGTLLQLSSKGKETYGDMEEKLYLRVKVAED